MKNYAPWQHYAALFLVLCIPFSFLNAQWQSLEGPFAGFGSLPKTNGSSLFVFSWDDIYRSDNDGDSWQIISQDIPAEGAYYDLQVAGNIVVTYKVSYVNPLATEAFYISYNGGSDWTYLPPPIVNKYGSGTFVLLADKIIYASEDFFYEMRFSDMRWRPSSLNDVEGDYVRFVRIQNEVFALGSSDIARSTDDGISWTKINTATVPGGYPESFWAKGQAMFITRYINGPGNYWYSKTYRSANGGQTWTGPLIYDIDYITGVVEFKGAWFGKSNNQLITSQNGGVSWQPVAGAPAVFSESLASFEDGLFYNSGYNYFLYRTQTATNQIFKEIPLRIRGGDISAVYGNDSVVLASTRYRGLHRFQDNTGAWKPEPILPTKFEVGAITQKDGLTIAGLGFAPPDSAVYISPDNGNTWSLAGLTNDGALHADIDHIFCANHRCVGYKSYPFTSSDWFSEDNGYNWKNMGIEGQDLKVYHDSFYITAYGWQKLSRSADGLNWTILGNTGLGTNETIQGFYPIGDDIYVRASASNADSLSLYVSKDGGFTWQFLSKQFGETIDASPIWGNADLLISHDDNYALIYSKNKGVDWFLLPPVEQISHEITTTDEKYLYAKNHFVQRLAFSDRHYRQVKVIAYHDLDGDHQKDFDEPVLPGILVRAPVAGYVLATDSSGTVQMTLNIAPGAIDTVLVSAPETFYLKPSVGKVPVSDSDTKVYAGFVHNAVSDLGVFAGQTKPLREGKNSAVVTAVKNSGGLVFSGTGQMKMLLPELLSGAQTFPAPDSQNGDTLVWNIPVLLPDSSFLVTTRFMSPGSLVFGDHYLFKAWIDAAAPDAVSYNDSTVLDIFPSWIAYPNWNFVNRSTVALQQVATGSTGLTYCTGVNMQYSNSPDTASNVLFHHVFRPEQDMGSIKIIASSHPVKVKTLMNGDIVFYMETALVYDTTAGEKGYCYVLYTVDPVRDLKMFDFISHALQANYNINSGYWGDIKRPITQVTDGLSNGPQPPEQQLFTISASPNPSHGAFTINTAGRDFEDGAVTITDAAGKVHYRNSWNGGAINAKIPAGVYSVLLSSTNGVGICRLVIVD